MVGCKKFWVVSGDFGWFAVLVVTIFQFLHNFVQVFVLDLNFSYIQKLQVYLLLHLVGHNSVEHSFPRGNKQNRDYPSA